MLVLPKAGGMAAGPENIPEKGRYKYDSAVKVPYT
jgi:hypothetical protein